MIRAVGRSQLAVDPHLGRDPRAAELDRVGEQVLDQLAHLQRVGADRRQPADVDGRPGALDLVLEIDEHLARYLGQVNGRERPAVSGDAREPQQVLDQLLHPLGGRVAPLEVIAPVVRQVLRVDLGQPLGERADLAQRLLQVVRGDRRELLELRVGARELGGAALEARICRRRARTLSNSSRAFASRTAAEARTVRRASASARIATSANAAKISHGIHLCSPVMLANSGPFGAASTIRQVELCERDDWS